jgi:hypothetical protein
MEIHDRPVLMLIELRKNTYAVLRAKNTLAVDGYAVMRRAHGKVTWHYVNKQRKVTKEVLDLFRSRVIEIA